MKRQERIERIRAVEREFLAAAAALELLADRLQADPTVPVGAGWTSRDARKLRQNLETTFLIRLYAEFEAGLRDSWQNAFHRPTHPPMKDLLSALATLQRLSQAWYDAAERVREFRNGLVHEGGDSQDVIAFAVARSHLCRFFSALPPDW